MAVNPLRGEADLAAGERTLKLCLDVNAFCYAEQELGRTTDEIIADLEARPANMALTRVLVWAALQKHHPETHLIEAGEIISDAGFGEARSAVTDCLSAAFGRAGDKDGARPPRKKAGAGTG